MHADKEDKPQLDVLAVGAHPDDVEITMVAMGEITADLLKRYRDLGIHRVNIGVGMENWNKPEIIMPMIEQFSKIIPEL